VRKRTITLVQVIADRNDSNESRSDVNLKFVPERLLKADYQEAFAVKRDVLALPTLLADELRFHTHSLSSQPFLPERRNFLR